MAWAEKVLELDEHIAVAVKTALRNLQSDLDERLKQSTEAMRERLASLEAALPTSFLADRDLEPIASAAEWAARERTLEELRDALAAIDRAPSQMVVLSTLLETTTRYCSRAALFLTREDHAKGLAARGFADASRSIDSTSFAYNEGSAWGDLALGRASVSLGSADAAEFAQELETVVAREAVLVPLVLADRVAAALYADRIGPDGILLVPALQTLVAAAAQTIELLPLRSRAVTPTFIAPGTESGAPGLALWAASVAQAPAAVPPPAAEPAAPPTLVVTQETAVIEEVELPGDFDLVEEQPFEPELPAPWQSPVRDELFADLTPEPAAVEPTTATFSEAFTEAIPAVAPPAEPAWPDLVFETPSEYELPAPEELAPPAPEEAAEPELLRVEEPPAPFFEPATANFELPAAALPDVSTDQTVLLSQSAFTIPAPIPTPPPTSAFEAEEEPEEATHPGRAGFTPRPPERGGASREVRPPTDFEGPGLAFGGGGRGLAAEGTAHEEARRLARLLVSEIRLYNEDQVEEGRRNRDIYSRLRDEIDRSRKMFEERVAPDVRAARDYFTEELVRRLADGDPDALGM